MVTTSRRIRIFGRWITIFKRTRPIRRSTFRPGGAW